MENMPFVMWVLGWPVISSNFDIGNEIYELTFMAGVWIGVGILLYK